LTETLLRSLVNNDNNIFRIKDQQK
jgi:hypothetical protein